MASWPTLIIHFSRLVKLHSSEQVKLNLTRLDTPAPIKQQEAGVITLPFPSELIPYFHYQLNCRQLVDDIGQAASSLEQPTTTNRQNNILRKLKITDVFGKIVEDPPLPTVLGQLIGSALQQNPIVNYQLQQLFNAVAIAEDGGIKGGEIILSFEENTLALTAIPWELTYYNKQPLFLCPANEAFLCYSRTIIGESSQSSSVISTNTSIVGEKIHLLAASSHVRMDEHGIKLERESYEKLRSAVGAYSIVIDPLEHVSMSRLQSKLLEHRIDILNYWGHGDFRGGSSVLPMENEFESPVDVTVLQFNSLSDKPSVIVFLACHTAQIDVCHPNNSLPFLLRNDVQAVVAMQFAVRMQEVTDMIIPTFYEELVKPQSIQRAVARVRKELFTQGKEGWYVPVLYIKPRSQSGQGNTDYQPYIPFEQITRAPNPFALHGIPAGSQQFIGRTVELQTMWDRLFNNSSFAIAGAVGTGKTSMLHLIMDKGPKMLASKNHHTKQLRIAWLDVLSGNYVHSAEQVIVDQLDGKKASELRKLLRDNRVILLVDNLSALNPGQQNTEGRRDQKFLEWLSSLLNQAQLIVTLRPPIDRLFPRPEKPPLYDAINMSINLGEFTKEDARRFVKQRLVGSGYTYEQFKDLVEQGVLKTPQNLRMECYERFQELLKESKQKR